MIDRRPIPSKEKNWKSSGGNGRGGTKWLSLRDREKPVSDLRTRFFPRFVRCTERGSAPGVHAFYDAIYMHNVTAASTWEHGYVAISCRSFLLRDPARTVSLPTPFAPRRVEKDDRGGAKGERHAIAMLEIDQWVFLALLAVRLAAWLRIYCVSIFRGTIVRSDAFIVALVALLVSCFSVNEMGMEKERYRAFI